MEGVALRNCPVRLPLDGAEGGERRMEYFDDYFDLPDDDTDDLDYIYWVMNEPSDYYIITIGTITRHFICL